MVYDQGEKTIDGLDGNRLPKTHALSTEDKWRLEHLGALGIMGEMAY